MLHITSWKGAPPKAGISSWCEVQEVGLSRIPDDPEHEEYRFSTQEGSQGSRVRLMYGQVILPVAATNAIYGGLQVFDARVDVYEDGSADLHALIIEGKEYEVFPSSPR